MPRARACYFAMRGSLLCTMLAAGLNLAFQRCSVFCALVEVSTTPLIHKCLRRWRFRAPVLFSLPGGQVLEPSPPSRPWRRAPPRMPHDNSRAGCAARAPGFCARAWQISEDSIATSAQQRELNLRVAEAPEALVTSGVASRQAVRHQSASKGRSAAAALWHRKSAAAAHPLALWPADARR